MRTVWTLVLLAVAVLLPACGRKSLPLPPIIEVPETTTDLWGYQDGTELVLTWAYPQLTRGGRPLNDLARVEIWQLQLAPGQEQVGSGPAGEDLRRQLMLGRGKLVVRLEGESLQAATQGKSLIYREKLPEVLAGTSPPTLWYAVRSRRKDGTSSALSNFVTWQPQPILATPTFVVAEPNANGIELSWDLVPGVGYVVERHLSKLLAWDVLQPVGFEKPSFLDTKAEQGQTWWYRVRSYVKPPHPPTASPPTPEIEVPYPDIYPPPSVTSFICLPEPTLVRLRWDASKEPNVRYKIFRQFGDGGWDHLEEDFKGTEYADTSPPSGEVEYAVKAMDAAGNQSDAVYCKVRAGT